MKRERKALTYAVTEVNGDEFTKARENNLGNALSGKIAGVNASSSATGPGGSSRVIIRGNGSLSGDNQPLSIINGVPINNATQGHPLSTPHWQYEYGSGSRGIKPGSQAEAIANGRISWGAKLDGSPVFQPDGVARPYSAQKHNIRNFYNNGKTFSNTVALTGGN